MSREIDVDVARLASDLVAIPSDPPRHPETAVSSYLKALFERNGCACIDIPTRLGPGRHDLLVLPRDLAGDDTTLPPGRGLLFSGHMDVVPPGDLGDWERREAGPWIDPEGFLHGRGAVDMKGGIAAYITAFLKHVDAITREDTTLVGMLFTVDEETSLAGVNGFVSSRYANLFGRAVLAEPTGLHPVRGHKGVLFMRFDVKGKAAHGAVPDKGVNAVKVAMAMYGAIDAQYQGIRATRAHDVLGSPTLNLGIIAGGGKVNVVPDACTFSIDRRINPGEGVDGVIAEALSAAGGALHGTGASFSHEVINARPPYFLDDEHPFLQALCPLVGPPAVMNGYTEAGILFNDANIPTVILGPGTIDGAHVANEKIAITDLLAAERLYERIILGCLGR